MSLTNTQLKFYDSNVLRLPDDKRTEYDHQVKNLISSLNQKLKDQTGISISNVVKSGSFAKYTILKKTNEDPVDVDIVFFISGRDIGNETLPELSETIHDLLISIYPQKKVGDFTIQRKATTVEFQGSGLSVDIVPVIEDPSRPGYGWQFDQNGLSLETCPKCQIDFVKARKDIDGDFRTLVRLAKKWRNYSELTHFKSFMIELIMAHLLDKDGPEGTIEQKFRRFLQYIGASKLKETIKFPENKPPFEQFDNPVIIYDPASSANNIAGRIKEQERSEIVETANTAWEVAHEASAKEDLEMWKELFGSGFKVEKAA
jgi:tRNA nucleotidyltransferase (CCA-adding enzyme)